MTLPKNMRLAVYTISYYRTEPLSSAFAEVKRENSHLSPRIPSTCSVKLVARSQLLNDLRRSLCYRAVTLRNRATKERDARGKEAKGGGRKTKTSKANPYLNPLPNQPDLDADQSHHDIYNDLLDKKSPRRREFRRRGKVLTEEDDVNIV